jgi:hypothetical protein
MIAVSALERELLARLAEEERLLEPILARLDAWGPIRVSLLQRNMPISWPFLRS